VAKVFALKSVAGIMAAMAHVAGMGGCWLASAGSMRRLGLAGGRAMQGGAREVWLGNGGVRTKGMHARVCKAEEDDATSPKEGVNPLDLEQELRKALESEESKVKICGFWRNFSVLGALGYIDRVSRV
jgi:hypothetical protein